MATQSLDTQPLSSSIQVIELHMMDKRKYFPLAMASSFVVRGCLYPVSLIKTRLQIQKQKAVYSGTFDAFAKIAKAEGVTGLYRGFIINSLQMIPSILYISTYESARHVLARTTYLTDNRVRSFLAGACASMVGQTLVVPVDIISQYHMILGQTQKPKTGDKVSRVIPLNFPAGAFNKDGRISSKTLIKVIYKQEGLMGFYKGYWSSIAVFVPNSALWWTFYDVYSNLLASVAPVWTPRLLLQVIAAPLSGTTTSLLTNPMDIIRARIQVERRPFMDTARMLWREEHFRIFTKGLSARIIQSVTFSFTIILGYESIKRWSLLDEYKHSVRW